MQLETSASGMKILERDIHAKAEEIQKKTVELKAALQRMKDMENFVSSSALSSVSSSAHEEEAGFSGSVKEIKMLHEAMNIMEKRLETAEKENKHLKNISSSSTSSTCTLTGLPTVMRTVTNPGAGESVAFLGQQVGIWKGLVLKRLMGNMKAIPDFVQVGAQAVACNSTVRAARGAVYQATRRIKAGRKVITLAAARE